MPKKPDQKKKKKPKQPPPRRSDHALRPDFLNTVIVKGRTP